MTEVLPEGHEEVVIDAPVSSRQLLSQRHFGVLWRLGPHVAPAVADAMDVRIDADAVLVVRKRDHEVRRLAAHALDRQQLIQLVWHLAVTAIQECAAD